MYIRKFLSEHKHFYKLLLMIPILIWFKLLEAYITPRFIIHVALDNKIPFIKQFVIPYILWFPYVAFGLVYTGLHSKKDFDRLFFFLMSGMSVAYAVCTLFPNGQNLRPVISQSDVFSDVIKFLYATDTPTNVCPSVHVINAIAIDIALRHTEDFAAMKPAKTISALLTVLICLSTVLIKQHSVVDVLCGAVVAGLIYIVIYKPAFISVRSKKLRV